MAADDRAIGLDNEGISTIRTLRRPSGQPQVTAHLLTIPEQEGILVVYGAYHIHRAGLGGNHEAITIFQLYVGQAVDSAAF